jgi:hypothetical protein
LVLGPLLLGVSGLFHARRRAEPSTEPAIPWNWKQTISSALLYTLAFNLTFFIQELFLVLPKALTPGVRATLFHNSHSWEGENPLTSLFQGTGALAIPQRRCLRTAPAAPPTPLVHAAAVPHLDGLQRALPGAAAGRHRGRRP